MTALVIAEHDNRQLADATLRAIDAASRCADNVHVLVAGHDCEVVAQTASRIPVVGKVLHVEAAHLGDHLPEDIAAHAIAVASSYTHVVAAATTFGKAVAPRIAACIDVTPIADVIRVAAPDAFERPLYAGSAVALVRSTAPIKVLTARPTAFDAAKPHHEAAPIEGRTPLPSNVDVQVVSRETARGERPDLASARIVVAGGRGLGSRENFLRLLEPLADCLGAALGASRAAVDAGYVENRYQVGQTGTIVAPELYIAVGISGAVQHLAGMKDARTIVAINSDPAAPIFAVADYGVVGDLNTIVPDLVAALS